MNKFIDGVKAAFKSFKEFAFPEDGEEPKGPTLKGGSIHIITPELEVKAKFDDEESMLRIQTIINNEIELRFNRMVEMR